jgi:hypothetical protein
VFSHCTALVLFSAVCFAATPAESVPFKKLDRGQQSFIEESREVVVRSAAEWAALWKQHAPDQQPPAVDFTRSMVVGVFLGSRPTGGHSVEITRVDREGSDLVVTYRERQPGSADIVTQVITMPYELVTIDRFDGKVRFTRAQ